MMLDRERLAGYVGHDAAFELEFLKLLKGTVSDCLDALSDPSPQIHETLHAAKAGLSVATSEEVRNSISRACDLTVNLSSTDLMSGVRATLIELKALLHQLDAEIVTILAANDSKTA